MWDPAPIDPALRATAADLGRQACERLADDRSVQVALRRARRQSLLGEVWDVTGLANGLPGLALMFGVVGAEPVWDAPDATARATQLLLEAVGRSRDVPYTTYDLYSGTSGLAFAMELARSTEPRLSTPLGRVLVGTRRLLEDDPPQAAGSPPGYAPEYYDVVGGSAGLLAASLTLATGSPGVAVDEVAAMRGAAAGALRDLFSAPAGQSPPWWVSPELTPVVERVKTAPRGYYDTGVAHGAAGVVAALALAIEADHPVDAARPDDPQSARAGAAGLHETLGAVVDWLLAATSDDEHGMNWPSIVPVGPVERPVVHPSRTAWCYGAPGILVALALAARVLERPDVHGAVEVGTVAVVSRLRASSGALSTPTLCHGEAGVLAALAHLACEHGVAAAAEGLDLVTRALLTRFDPTSRFGFQDVEPGDRRVDNPTLLNGAAGVVLALHLVASGTRPRWTRFLALG